MKKYKLAACGGTFDLLHVGHKEFLTQIFNDSENVIIGLTSDKFAGIKNSEIEDFETRKNELADFLQTYNGRYKVSEINDVYGPLLDKNIKPDVLYVTYDTQKGAEIINSKIAELGLPKIKVEILEMKKSEEGIEISSTRIRNGEIDREGKLYVKDKWRKNILTLPESLRPKFQKPFGKVLNNIPVNLDGSKIITIGDITTRKFNLENIDQKLSIIDFQVQREIKFNKISDLGFEKDLETISASNKAGSINGELFESISNSLRLNTRQIILIEGEEDLVVIPAILVAPLGFRIYYGQPGVGLVEVIVSEEIKEKVFDLLSKFTY